MTYTIGSLRFVTGNLKVVRKRTSQGVITGAMVDTTTRRLQGSEWRGDISPFASILDFYDTIVEQGVFVDEVGSGRGSAKLTSVGFLRPDGSLSDEEYYELTKQTEEINNLSDEIEEISDEELLDYMVKLGLVKEESP